MKKRERERGQREREREEREQEERKGEEKEKGQRRIPGGLQFQVLCKQIKLFSKGFFVLSVAVPTSGDFIIIHKNKARKAKVVNKATIHT